MRIEINIFERRCREEHRRAVRGRFAGAFYLSNEGEITLSQAAPGGTAITAPIDFVDQHGQPIKGPMGALTSSDAANTPTLSADGQAANVMTPAATGTDQTITISWNDPAGKIAGFSVDLVVAAVVPVAVSGSFGTFVPGTTP